VAFSLHNPFQGTAARHSPHELSDDPRYLVPSCHFLTILSWPLRFWSSLDGNVLDHPLQHPGSVSSLLRGAQPTSLMLTILLPAFSKYGPSNTLPTGFFAFRVRCGRCGSDSASVHTTTQPQLPTARVSGIGVRHVGKEFSSDVTGDGPSKFVTDPWTRDNWDIGEALGNGNFSTVRSCICHKDGRRYAVKSCNKDKFHSFILKRQSHLSLHSEANLHSDLHRPK